MNLNPSPGKKIFFASDFHLGIPNPESSISREKRIIRWLDSIKSEASAIFLLGDLFDFWFEYRKAVPKGHTRFMGTLAQLTDLGIPVYVFTGNHDMWTFGYLEKELGVKVFHNPIQLQTEQHRFLVGHGDGLGPGDSTYKFLKKIFVSPLARFLFSWIHPDLGISLAQVWSKNSRIANQQKEEKYGSEEKEFLLSWCKEEEKNNHHDFYIFGHRHATMDLPAGPASRYLNLGEWVHGSTFAEYDGEKLLLKTYQPL